LVSSISSSESCSGSSPSLSLLPITLNKKYLYSEPAPGKDVLDQAFFREYQGLDEATKEKLRDLVKVWRRKE
jgi:hypothetical protein